MSEHLVNGKYSIRDLVDLEKLKEIFEQFSEVTGYTTGFVSYPELEVLISTGWRDICTKFHRSSAEGEHICKVSNKSLLGRLKNLGDLSIEKCGHGLVDGATPVIIKGTYVACVATGQVFFEEPDIDWFRKHGEELGYDVEGYIKTVKAVPVVSEEDFRRTLTFLTEFSAMICEMGFYSLEEKENAEEVRREIKRREKAEIALLKQQDHLETAVEERTADLNKKINELEDALAHIKRLEGLVPICSNCKNMLLEGSNSLDSSAWIPLEKYISDRTEAQFTHGLCPRCVEKLYGHRNA